MSTQRIYMKEDVVRHTLDVGAAGVWIASMAELLPPIAAFLSIIWLSIQIVDYIIKKWRGRK